MRPRRGIDRHRSSLGLSKVSFLRVIGTSMKLEVRTCANVLNVQLYIQQLHRDLPSL